MYTRFRRGGTLQGNQNVNQQNPPLMGQRRSQTNANVNQTAPAAQTYNTQQVAPVAQQPIIKQQPSTPKVEPMHYQQPQQQQQQQQQQIQQLQQVKPDPVIQEQKEQPVIDLESVSVKKFWASRKVAKVSKQEMQRRRNVRLGRLLQPKNAVMIFNELVQNPHFEVVANAKGEDSCQYKATVVLDGQEHIGFGRNKIQAKNNAAELAIRYLIRKRKISQSGDGSEKMETEEESATSDDAPIPWQHVASLALFKLFDSWGEDTTKDEVKETKPAKKMPDKPETLQPLMLLNQMIPNVQFEEINRTGQPPNIEFTYKCVVEGQEFIGKGARAKLAKRMAAFAACHKMLNVVYPPEVWQP